MVPEEIESPVRDLNMARVGAALPIAGFVLGTASVRLAALRDGDTHTPVASVSRAPDFDLTSFLSR